MSCWYNMQLTCSMFETNLGVIGFLWLTMYLPLAEGVVAARICALATSLTSTMTGVPAITSLSRQAYCKADWQTSGKHRCIALCTLKELVKWPGTQCNQVRPVASSSLPRLWEESGQGGNLACLLACQRVQTGRGRGGGVRGGGGRARVGRARRPAQQCSQDT